MYNDRKHTGRYKPLQTQKSPARDPWLYPWEWAILFLIAVGALILALI